MNNARDLFQLHSELIDRKVDIAVNTTIDRVVQKIDDLRSEMHNEMHDIRSEVHDLRLDMNQKFHDLRHEMYHHFSKLDTRVVAIETKLGMIGEKKKGVYDRTMDLLFKAGYGVLTFVSLYFAFLFSQLHLIH